MSSQSQIEKIIDLAMEEDTGRGDVTTEILIPTNLVGTASIVAGEEGILAGGEIVKIAFLKIDSSLKIEIPIQDGDKVKPGDVAITISGRVINILKVERTALNFLSRLSGVATETAKYVAKVKGLSVIISDTRKTTPGLRMLEKYAVYAAGGKSQRPDLASGIIIKDNHIVALRAKGKSLKDIVAMAKKDAREGLKVTVEVNTVQEVEEAVQGEADTIMLDNMPLDDMKKAVDLVPEKIMVEASGGITLDNVYDVAMTGVDSISVGAITHSAKALDFSLEFLAPEAKPSGGEEGAST